MVLKATTTYIMVLAGVYATLVSCSLLDRQESKRETIVPAQIPNQEVRQDSLFDSKKELDKKSDLEAGAGAVHERKSAASGADTVETEKKLNASARSSSDLLTILLDKAKKAMELQQWLRAQRTLEQALRIKPNSVDTYILYGDVYKGMGLANKSTEMYKRAVFLSGNDGSLRQELLPEELD